MAMHIIIDGYNLIRQSPGLSSLDNLDLATGREALIDALAAYKRIKPHMISVIFDGTNAPAISQRRDRLKGIDIIFSRHGESADTVIKRMVAKKRETALVVTSDGDVARAAIASGASVISSPEFDSKLHMAQQFHLTGDDDWEDVGWKPTTKKKGPRRRLSKRERRSRKKIAKL